ncbi:hypothetical protein TPHA_0A03100 [Tetrapisispora phaffii CBS 4417]|uniref:Protein transport protein SEC31 n=1 Tax=Tetrapisispora phaffii (strain ATCC 24235 / CBS 4417 / NBRC 1672 / NRRL Y-8282 / UCD 70-5) TaxID=1071381 RepID=G8BNB0_TETPH|nr:hypothetical protein TPHA_0A03100 [Tetrapisispora phaffii CBS 4417]CCE61388.1 hypothetical protein TPHA_0A03100 [Tetrapisispora phaffii CBS 4417]
MVQVIEYPVTATFAWSKHKLPYLVSGTYSNAIDPNFSSESKLELWSINQINNKEPIFSLNSDSKFNDLDWSGDNVTIAGALDNGSIEIFKFNQENDSIQSNELIKNNRHTGPIRSITFNPRQDNLLLSGGEGIINSSNSAKTLPTINNIQNTTSEIFIYDLNDVDNPETLPMSPNMTMNRFETISSLAWNKSLSHVFSAAGNTSAVSIFDLKAKKEVINLNYINPTTGMKEIFSVVEWHPKNSTRIATATSNNISNPLNATANAGDSIYIWDLRNSNAPLQILSPQQFENNTIVGHTDGIQSLDWCAQDETFLLSSGRDNSIMLWNPDSGLPLTKYPKRNNWCFKSKFAPNFPEIFASASLDGKIEVQTLQNIPTISDEEENNSKQQESETDFWNNVSTEKVVEKATVFNFQAPSWYNNIIEPAATWSFGGKLVSISKDGKSININKPNLPGYFQDNKNLEEALQNKDFSSIINQRLIKPINESNEEDWNFIEKLNLDGKDDYLNEAFAFEDAEEESTELKNNDENDDFFVNLENSFEPTGKFALKEASDQVICRNLITGDIKKAVARSLEKDYLMEALVIALSSDDESLKTNVKNAYFARHGGKTPLSRFLFSISSSNSADLVDNLKLSQWKYAVKSVYRFYSNKIEERNQLLKRLGDRLLESGNRQDALTLYLAADSIDDVAAIWLKEFSSNESKIKEVKGSYYEAHTECLTEFVERFSALSKFVGSDSQISNEDLISKFLEFVALSTAAGNFDLAYKFLETLPGDNEQVNTEKQRVLSASGKSQAKQQAQTKSTRYGNLSSSIPSTDSLKKMPPFAPTAAPIQQTFGAPIQQNYGLPASVSPIPQLPNTIGTPPTSKSPQPVVGSRYAPQAPVAPTIGATNAVYPQIAVPQPTNTFQVPANPYSTVKPTQPVFAHLNNSGSSGNLASNPIANGPASLPPPPINMRSGQIPHLTKEANDGWNDLPLKSKDKPSRAKAVAVAPVAPAAASTAQQTTPISLNTIRPPPMISRSSSMMGSNMAQGKSKVPVANQKIPSNPYAPSNNVVSSPAISPPPHPAPAHNPYAPPVALTPNDAKLGYNPYIVPTNAAQTTSTPPLAAKAPIGPPPVNSRKKGPSGNEIVGMNTPTTTNVGVPTSSMTAPAPVPAQSPVPAVKSTTLPPDQQDVIIFFQQELERVTPLIPKEYGKQLKDCTKRLKILFEHLQNQDLLTQPTVDKLKQIIELMKTQSYDEATQISVAIATEHAHEGGNWLTGVKRLINIVKATS